MKKQVGIMLIFLATGICAMAQNDRDAFRYAQYSPTGTARYSALAGSMGAFGSDFSVLSAGNPAGIGLFKRFEFTITPALSYNKNISSYNGEEQREVDYDFALNNLGFVCVISPPTDTKWKMLHFATGLNNLARYDGISTVSGANERSTSFCEYLAAISNGTKFSSLSGYARDAWEHYLIDSITDATYYSRVDADFNQQQFRASSGYLNEYIFSLGGNYDDKLFLGATLGIPFFKYYQNTTYTESRNPYYDTLIVSDEFRSKATGLNLKLGIIYQPVKYLRVGAAFHTPTLYVNVKETFKATFDVWNIPFDSALYDISSGGYVTEFNYQLRTPYHAMANVAFIYKNIGFVNVDYEFVDYTNSEFSSNYSYLFGNENRDIRNYYKGTHTVRIGGELNLQPLVLRAGYAYSSNPYKKEVEKDGYGSRHTVSFGIGIKGKSVFADFAYVYKFTQDKDVFYDHISVNPYTNIFTNQLFALTLGWKIKK